MSYDSLCEAVKDAVAVLAPKFGIDAGQVAGFRKYSVVMVDTLAESHPDGSIKNAKYDYGKGEFTFSREAAARPSSVGHEVSHYLHYEVNPSVVVNRLASPRDDNSNFRYWHALELEEMVAEYGGLVYARSRGEIVDPSTSFFLLTDPGFMGQRYAIFAEQGFRRARVAVAKYGETQMARVIRLGLDESLNVLPELFPVGLSEQVVFAIRSMGKRMDRLR